MKKGQKYKLFAYKKLTDVDYLKINNKIKNEEKEEKKDISKNEPIEKDKNIINKEDEMKPIIKDKEKKYHKTRKDLLNSLNNLQYNFDSMK